MLLAHAGYASEANFAGLEAAKQMACIALGCEGKLLPERSIRSPIHPSTARMPTWPVTKEKRTTAARPCLSRCLDG